MIHNKLNKEAVTIYAELLSALSIVAAAGTFLYQSWASTRVSIDAAIVESTPTIMSILVTNSGGVDAAIRRIAVSAEGIQEPNIVKLPPGGVLLEKGKSFLVIPNRSRLSSTVKSDYLSDRKGSSTSDFSMTDCTADIELVDADGKTHKRSIGFKCAAACVVDLEAEAS